MPIDDELSPVEFEDMLLPSVLRAGYQIGGHYTLQRALGKGGYGSLWVAIDDMSGDEVAVKVLRATSSEHGFEEAAARLEREARALQQLDHPHIAKLRNFAYTDQGEPFIVMELLKGKDLIGKLGTGGRIPPRDAVELLLPIADALATAHDQGLIHRDVKGGNIFIAEGVDGAVVPMLIDFGLTKELDALASTQLTGAGVRLGSPSYMSPEAARGRGDVDVRSDVWSFCVVLYRTVTGQLPFEGKSQLDKRIAIIEHDPVPFESHGVDAPWLWQLVARGLEKNPDQRFQTMRELGACLHDWLAA